MRKSLAWIAIFLSAAFVSVSAEAKEEIAVGSNTTRRINIDKSFTGLHSSAGVEITYTEDNKGSMAVINGPSEIVNGMDWEVNSKGILSFSLPKNKRNYSGKITIQLNGRMLRNYESSSSGTINVTTAVKGKESLNFAVSSSGNIFLQKEVDVPGNDINIAGSSSGEVIFMSTVRSNTAKIALSSSSTVKIPILINATTLFAGSSTGILELGNIIMKEFDVALSSGGECNVKEGKIQSLNIACSSGGEYTGRDFKVNEMSLSSSSGGTITIKGVCSEATMAATSGGDINVKGMKIVKTRSQKTASGGRISSL